MRRVVGFVFAVVGILITIFFAFLVSFPIVPFVVVPRGRRERYAIHGARLFAWLVLRPLLWLRIERVGLEKLPRGTGYLVLSNHRSWIDVPMLMYFTSSSGISKKEVKYIPFFGVNGYVAGAIFFDRTRRKDRARVVSEALLLLRGGGNLHVFPEGTRTRDGRINPRVYLRLAQSCWENGIDVVPACVWGTEAVVPSAGVYAMPGQSVGIEVETPLDRTAFADGEAYAAATWAKVVEISARRGCDNVFPEKAIA